MIHVIAIITTIPGSRAEVLDAFAAIVPTVHAEEGCIEYQPVTDVDNVGAMQTQLGEDSFMVVEKWSSLENLTKHAESEHMREYGNKVKHLIAGRVIHVLN